MAIIFAGSINRIVAKFDNAPWLLPEEDDIDIDLSPIELRPTLYPSDSTPQPPSLFISSQTPTMCSTRYLLVKRVSCKSGGAMTRSDDEERSDD